MKVIHDEWVAEYVKLKEQADTKNKELGDVRNSHPQYEVSCQIFFCYVLLVGMNTVVFFTLLLTILVESSTKTLIATGVSVVAWVILITISRAYYKRLDRWEKEHDAQIINIEEKWKLASDIHNNKLVGRGDVEDKTRGLTLYFEAPDRSIIGIYYPTIEVYAVDVEEEYLDLEEMRFCCIK